MARFLVIVCDHIGCDEQRSKEHVYNMPAFGPLLDELKEQGWTMQYKPIRMRSGNDLQVQHHYCPRHKPKKGRTA